MYMSKKASVAQKRKGFTVSASPFNAVKLDLVVVLIVGVVLVLLLERLFNTPLWQFALIAGYGLVAALWLLIRVKGIERQLARQQPAPVREDKDGQNEKQ